MSVEKLQKMLLLLALISVVASAGHYIKKGCTTYNIAKENSQSSGARIKVAVAGEVLHPGTYSLPENSRVCEAVYAAGGITMDANVESIKLDAIVTDGFELEVPSYGSPDKSAVPVININTADADTLTLIPGIGEVMAQRIVDYREEHGNYIVPEDITRVRGIGEKTFNKIRDYIRTEE